MALIGAVFLVSSGWAVHAGVVGNTPETPLFVASYWTMTAINVCFLGFLVLGSVYLFQLRALGVAICNIVFVGEILYFLVTTFLWFPRILPEAMTTSVAAATGLGNMGLSPQLATAYPLIAMGCINLARLFQRKGTRLLPVPD